MTIVTAIPKQMLGVRQSQWRFLATLFAMILIVRGRINYRNLSRYGDYSGRTLARQFRASFDWSEFHQHILTAALVPGAVLISAQDASF